MFSKCVVVIVCLLSVVNVKAQMSVASPDGTVRATLVSHKKRFPFSRTIKNEYMSVNVVFDNKTVVNEKEMNMTVKSKGKRYVFGKSDIVDLVTEGQKSASSDNACSELSDMAGLYNSIRISTTAGITLEVRAYNNGVAYRYLVAGYPDAYKILTMTNVFNAYSGIADYGTFEGDISIPWKTLTKQEATKGKNVEITKNMHPSYNNTMNVLSWRDALSTVTVGINNNWYVGGSWKDVDNDYSFTADMTYKHLYAGVTYSPCCEHIYIFYDEGYYPFEKTIGSIHAWSLGGRLSFNLPVQCGYNIWSIAPYASFSLMHLNQHGATRAGYETPHPHQRYLVGPGMKIQMSIRGNITFGVNYEYSFFTSSKSAHGRHTFGLSLGHLF